MIKEIAINVWALGGFGTLLFLIASLITSTDLSRPKLAYLHDKLTNLMGLSFLLFILGGSLMFLTFIIY